MKHGHELRRKTGHIFLGVAIVLLLVSEWITPFFLLALALIFIPLSYLEPRRPIPIVTQLFDLLERPDQRKIFPGKGLVFYLLGSYLALLLFPQDIAYASILILAFGDSVGHLFGIHFGRRRHPLSDRKFLEGALAGFVAGTLAAMTVVPLLYAITGSAMAMLLEGVEMRFRSSKIDDNLIIPLVAGVTMLLTSFVVTL